jgi:hypothetical protein
MTEKITLKKNAPIDLLKTLIWVQLGQSQHTDVTQLNYLVEYGLNFFGVDILQYYDVTEIVSIAKTYNLKVLPY